MNATSDVWLRAAVVTAGTAMTVMLAAAGVALLPIAQHDNFVSQSPTVEAGLVYLPPRAAVSHARTHTEAPPRSQPEPPPPPPPPEPEVSPAPAEAVSPAPPRAEPANPAPSQATAQTRNGPMASTAPSRQSNPDEAGGGTGAAAAAYSPTPVIPPELRRHALDVVAVVRFTIGTDGKPNVALEEATADPQINAILLDTFRRWRFFPAMRNGKTVPSTLILRVPVKID